MAVDVVLRQRGSLRVVVGECIGARHSLFDPSPPDIRRHNLASFQSSRPSVKMSGCKSVNFVNFMSKRLGPFYFERDEFVIQKVSVKVIGSQSAHLATGVKL